MTKKSNDFKNKLNSFNNELETLQNRLTETDQKYSRAKANINLDDPQATEELQDLKAEKDLILELIEEKQVTIQKLEDDLQVQTEKDKREQTLNQLIDLANVAEKLENKFHTKLEMLDSLLSEKIPEIIKVRQEWEKTAKEFIEIGNRTLGKGLEQSTYYTKVRNGKSDELNADQLLKELAGKGVNLKPVTSGRVLSTQHFTHVSNARETKDLNFGENLFQMMKQSNIPKIQEKN